jgi:hypothetical protein
VLLLLPVHTRLAVMCCAVLRAFWLLSAALPTLDIAEGALNKLIDTYKRLLPQLGGYLTHAGGRLCALMAFWLGWLSKGLVHPLHTRGRFLAV